MKTTFSFIAAVFCLLVGMQPAIAGRTSPLVEKSYTFESKTPLTIEQVHDYILVGASRYKSELTYRIESDAPGALQLEFSKDNDITVSVLFAYTTEGFKANYVTSKNLNYGESNGARVIHPNYMVWIDDMYKLMKIAQARGLSPKGDVADKTVVAEMVFSTDSALATTSFEATDSHGECGEFEPVGDIRNADPAEIAATKKAIETWNEKHKGSKVPPVVYDEPMRKRTLYADEPKPVLLHGTVWLQGVTCTTPTQQFTPQIGKRYGIDMKVTLVGGRYLAACSQQISDVSNPDQIVAVAKEDVQACKKKGWFK